MNMSVCASSDSCSMTGTSPSSRVSGLSATTLIMGEVDDEEASWHLAVSTIQNFVDIVGSFMNNKEMLQLLSKTTWRCSGRP